MLNAQNMNNRVFLLHPPPTTPHVTDFSLGLAYLSAVLRKRGYEVKVMDAAAPYNPRTPGQVKEAIKRFDPLFVGVTLKYDFITEKYKLVKEIQESGYKVVCGGPHVTIAPQEVIDNGADIISMGEGEEVIVELVEAFTTNRDLGNISGLGLRKEDGNIVFTQQRKEITDLDKLPFPDYSDFKVKDYTGVDDYKSSRTYFNIFTSRGCPYNCTYCSGSRIWKRGQKNRSARSVFEEIVYLVGHYGAKYIAFMDNEPLIDKKRIYELCDLLEKSRVNVKISTRVRIDNIDEDMLKRMKRVGFYRIAIGVESGDEETLRKVNRFYTREDILKSMKILERVNFPSVHFNNLIGFPWETKKHFKNTLELNKTIPKKLTYFVNVLTPLPMPGTRLYETYCDQYGFRDWWLDEYIQKKVHGSIKEKPFYSLFIPRLKLEFLRVDFWKYPKSIKKAILDFQLRLQKMAYSRNKKFSRLETAFAFFLIRVSILIYLISPKLEKIVFAPLKNKFMLNYAEKFVFKNQ